MTAISFQVHTINDGNYFAILMPVFLMSGKYLKSLQCWTMYRNIFTLDLSRQVSRLE